MTSTVKDRKHFQEPLAALDAAISGNRYPESRPMYVAVRMKIDGEVDRAEKLLRDDSRSDDLAVRIAAFRQIKHFGPAAVRFLPLLIETLDDAEPQLVLAAIRALGRLRDRDLDIDVSAAVPKIARQVEKQKGVYWLRDNLLRFLLEGDNAEHCPVGPIVGALSDSVPSNRSLAAVVLGRMGPRAEPALPALRKLLDDPDKSVRGAAQNAIEATRSLPPKVTQ